MKGYCGILLVALALALEGRAFAQESPPPAPPPAETPPAPLIQPTPQKRSMFNRVMHPFSGSSSPAVASKDPKLRGLSLDLQISPQTIKLSETRQLEIKLTLTNKSKRAIELMFPNDQRIEIQLLNSENAVLTKWSDNHALSEKPGVVLINPDEHIEYKETIATRELSPNKVFTADVFFPKYPDLRVRQKFLTAP